MWTFKTKLMRNIKPYTGGDLRLYDNQVFVMQVVEPALEFKTPVSAIKDDDPIIINNEFKEDWMDDTNEVLNRTKVRILKGTLENDVSILFETKGQSGSWWISDNSQIIYVTSEWLDYQKIDEYTSEDDYKKMTFFSIYKSTDGGQNFTQLEWPSHTRISQILFTQDGQKGYIVAGGPSLWRTDNGGKTWRAITIPDHLLKLGIGHTALERYQNELAEFDAYSLDNEGTLTVAGYTNSWLVKDSNKETKGSVIYQMAWNTKTADMNELQPIAFVIHLTVTDIVTAANNTLYLLTEYAEPTDNGIHPKDKILGFAKIEQGQVTTQHTFGSHLFLGTLYLGKDQLLYATGFSWTKNGLPNSNIAFISKDQGKTWIKQDEQKPVAVASYFDSEHNVSWQLKTYSLYFRRL